MKIEIEENLVYLTTVNLNNLKDTKLNSWLVNSNLVSKELSHGILSYFGAYKITFKLNENWK